MDPMLGGVIAQLQEHIVGVSAIADDLTQTATDPSHSLADSVS
ncbi:hypothetical protein [Mycolicibacterium komossense]|nr:hypothetical protein [Mycolicibacterium komossense]